MECASRCCRFNTFPSRARQGLTLIELLVALAVTVLLIGVVYLVYGTALNTIRTQTFRRERLEPAAEAMDVLRRDLLCSSAPRSATNPPFVLIPAGAAEPQTFSLRLFTACPGTGSNDWRAYGIHEIWYAMQTNGTPGRYALVRQYRPFRMAPAAARQPLVTSSETPGSNVPVFATETLLHSLAGLRIELYNGQDWTNSWGAGAGAGTMPLAARISLRLDLPSGQRTVISETLIPAGHKIKAPAKTDNPGLKAPLPGKSSAPANRPVP